MTPAQHCKRTEFQPLCLAFPLHTIYYINYIDYVNRSASVECAHAGCVLSTILDKQSGKCDFVHTNLNLTVQCIVNL